MRLRPDPASRFERFASIAAATVITVGGALLVLAPMPWRAEREAAPVPVSRAEQAAERLAFVTTRTSARPVVPFRHRPQVSNRQAGAVVSASQDAAPPAITPPVVPDTGSGRASQRVSPLLKPDAPATIETTTGVGNWWSAVGHAPAFGLTKGLLRRNPDAIRFDSALRVVHDSLVADLAPGRLKSPQPTQAERDVELRARALAAFAQRSTEGINRRPISGGASVPIGLPFSGPSREQRERDSVINAQTKEIQSRIQRRVDSTVAARRQRHVDSLAHVDHSSRQGTGFHM